MKKKLAVSFLVFIAAVVLATAIYLLASGGNEVVRVGAQNSYRVKPENRNFQSSLDQETISSIVKLQGGDSNSEDELPRSYKILNTKSQHLIPPNDPSKFVDYYTELLRRLGDTPDDIEVLERLFIFMGICSFSEQGEESLDEFIVEFSEKMMLEGKSHGEILEFSDHWHARYAACSKASKLSLGGRKFSEQRTGYALRASDLGGDYSTIMLALGVAAPNDFQKLQGTEQEIFRESVGENLYRSRQSCNPQILMMLASGNFEGEYWTRPQSNIPIGIQKFALWRTLGLASFHNMGKSGDQLKYIYESNMKVVEEYNLSTSEVAEAEALANAGFEKWCMED
jgi:hypothetical protein